MAKPDQTDILSLVQLVLLEVKKGGIPSTPIITLLLSKLLGIGMVAASFVLKVPQILALARSGSCTGLSTVSFELEQIGLSIHTAYGFLLGLPFNAFGEAAIILVQNTILLLQIYRLSKAPAWRPALIVGILGVGVFLCLSGRVTETRIRSAYEFNNVIFTAARLPQIVQNFRAKSTGQLSSATFVANFAGCLARIFTSYKEGGGASMIRGYILGSVLNGTIMAQCFYYGAGGAASKKAPRKAPGRPARQKKAA